MLRLLAGGCCTTFLDVRPGLDRSLEVSDIPTPPGGDLISLRCRLLPAASGEAPKFDELLLLMAAVLLLLLFELECSALS